jgi:hypothetical protein
MKSLTRLLAALGLVAMLAACASGPKYSEVASSIPTLKAGEGRIYFYRTGALGAAIQPAIMLNGKEVGKSQTGGFFFVDRPAGSYEVVMGTEVERKVTFTLDAGATRYVKTSISFGVFVGRPQAELVDPAEGRKEVAELAYTGPPLK